MNKTRGLAVLAIALLPLTTLPALGQGNFASFTGGAFQFTNLGALGAGSTFNSVGNGNDGGTGASFTDNQHNVSYNDITISLTSLVTGGPAVSPFADGTYIQNLDHVTLTFMDNLSGKTLLEATGVAQIVGQLNATTANFGGDNTVTLSDVQYSSQVLAVNNATNDNQYGMSLTLTSTTPLTLNANRYFNNFSTTATGGFTTGAVPEASTLLGFGMLMGGGLLGLRRIRRASAV
jgi:hypothetical protein